MAGSASRANASGGSSTVATKYGPRHAGDGDVLLEHRPGLIRPDLAHRVARGREPAGEAHLPSGPGVEHPRHHAVGRHEPPLAVELDDGHRVAPLLPALAADRGQHVRARDDADPGQRPRHERSRRGGNGCAGMSSAHCQLGAGHASTVAVPRCPRARVRHRHLQPGGVAREHPAQVVEVDVARSPRRLSGVQRGVSRPVIRRATASGGPTNARSVGAPPLAATRATESVTESARSRSPRVTSAGSLDVRRPCR